jgi:hypothetical protein
MLKHKTLDSRLNFKGNMDQMIMKTDIKTRKKQK